MGGKGPARRLLAVVLPTRRAAKCCSITGVLVATMHVIDWTLLQFWGILVGILQDFAGPGTSVQYSHEVYHVLASEDLSPWLQELS